MNTHEAHAHIRAEIAKFGKESVLYDFRFDNGKTKFGKSTNLTARAESYLVHGITGCTAVTAVRVPADILATAEAALMRLVRSAKYKRYANEVFDSSPSERHDSALIHRAISEALVSELTDETNPLVQEERAALSLGFNFNAQHANALKPGDYLPIEGAPGLRMVRTASRRSWIYRYKSPIDGGMRQIKIGEWPKVPVDEAISKWSALKLARASGRDMSVERRAARAG
jgi:hypothetical protein